jgi:hypothetical protein
MAHEMSPQHFPARITSLLFTAVFIISIFIPNELVRHSLMMLAGLPQIILMPAILIWEWQNKVRRRREEVLELFTQ